MKLRITRAPVLTLWASIVAERLGHDRATALTLGRAICGRTAHARVTRFGDIENGRVSPAERRQRERAETVAFMGKRIPLVQTVDGERALDTDENPIDPGAVESYLAESFGAALAAVAAAMTTLARSMSPMELRGAAFGLYELFRPAIPIGVKGWSAGGELDLDEIVAAKLAPAQTA